VSRYRSHRISGLLIRRPRQEHFPGDLPDNKRDTPFGHLLDFFILFFFLAVSEEEWFLPRASQGFLLSCPFINFCWAGLFFEEGSSVICALKKSPSLPLPLQLLLRRGPNPSLTSFATLWMAEHTPQRIGVDGKKPESTWTLLTRGRFSIRRSFHPAHARSSAPLRDSYGWLDSHPDHCFKNRRLVYVKGDEALCLFR